jgi:hypothetical protein
VCYRNDRGVRKPQSSRERESPVVVSRGGVVPVGGTGIYREINVLKQEVAELRKLLGHPVIQASGIRADAVEAQAPTGLFLLTHQQWLYMGAMHVLGEICGSYPHTGYTRTIVERVFQQQLGEADGSTTPRQIRACWHWGNTAVNSTMVGWQSAYTVEKHPPRQPTLAVAIMLEYQAEAISHGDTTVQFDEIPSTKASDNPHTGMSTRYNLVADALLAGITDELYLWTRGGPAPLPPLIQDEVEELGTTYGIDTTQLTQESVLYKKIKRIYQTRHGIHNTMKQAAESFLNSAYITYQRLPPPPEIPA